MATQDELYTKFSTGKKPNGDDFKELIDFRGADGAKGDKGDTGAVGAKGDKGDTGATGAKGEKGDTGTAGAKGDKGDAGAKGASVKSIAFTTTDGKVTGGTATLTDNTTVPVTVTES